MIKKLSNLLSFRIPKEYTEFEVEDIVDDSRKVKLGDMFIAVTGTNQDGRNYINDAMKKGADFIVSESEKGINEIIRDEGVFHIKVKNIRKELSHIAAKFYPSNFENLIAVTGTNGKSSTVSMIRDILNFYGKSAASIGTLGIISENLQEKLLGNMTSPGALVLHKIFHKLVEQEIKNVALEASSHGIHQHRLDGLNFSVCAFTNLSQDHLDYHKNMENYWAAKERLFSEVAPQNSVFIIDDDDPYSKKIREIAKNRKIRCIGYGKTSEDLKIERIEPSKKFQKIDFLFNKKNHSYNLPIQGEFQVYNSLCALLSCFAIGLKVEDILAALEKIKPISGRLELVAEPHDAQIYIDYAHTPDALKNALTSLRKITKEKLFVVFGCGGNRDQTKREIMGQIASDYADVIFVTDDNPRTENPAEIRKMILKGCPDALEVDRRKKAIEDAVDFLKAGDVLLIAGKGHEDYQIIGTETIHFSDKEVVLNRMVK